jgi:hypothetical protein
MAPPGCKTGTSPQLTAMVRSRKRCDGTIGSGVHCYTSGLRDLAHRLRPRSLEAHLVRIAPRPLTRRFPWAARRRLAGLDHLDCATPYRQFLLRGAMPRIFCAFSRRGNSQMTRLAWHGT